MVLHDGIEKGLDLHEFAGLVCNSCTSTSGVASRSESDKAETPCPPIVLHGLATCDHARATNWLIIRCRPNLNEGDDFQDGLGL